MKNKKIIFRLMFCICFLFICIGCGKHKNKYDSVVEWWYPDPSPLRTQQGKIFRELHPEIELKEEIITTYIDQKLLVSLAGGVSPDVVFAMPDLANSLFIKDVLEPLDNFVDADKSFNKNDYVENVWQIYSYNGKQGAIPGNCTSTVMYYNKKMFDEAGVEHPNENWTWEKYIEEMKKLTKKDKNGITVQFGSLLNIRDLLMTSMLIEQAGGRYYNEDGTKCAINNPGAVKVFTMLKNISYKYNIAPTHQDFQNMAGQAAKGMDIFSMKRGATCVSGRWRTIDFRKVKDLDFRIAPVPTFEKGRKINRLMSMGWAIPRMSKNKKGAWELVKFLCGEQSAKLVADSGDAVPVIKKIVSLDEFLNDPKHPNEDNKIYMEGLKTAISFKVSNYITQYQAEEIFLDEADKFMLTSQDVYTTLRNIEQRTNKVITENLNKK